MMKPMTILALAKTDQQKVFFQEIKEHFAYLLTLTIRCELPQVLDSFDGLFTFEEVRTDLPAQHFSFEKSIDGYQVTLPALRNIESTLALSQLLNQFQQKAQFFLLDALPFRLRLHDRTGKTLYSNHRPEDPFDFFEDDELPLDSWVMSSLKDKDQHQLDMLIPSASFDHILIQHYQELFDKQGKSLGYFEYIQDLKPILEAYLKESGQALVGWSDVTSGASISNDDFDF